jgi:hypothetical protein
LSLFSEKKKVSGEEVKSLAERINSIKMEGAQVEEISIEEKLVIMKTWGPCYKSITDVI